MIKLKQDAPELNFESHSKGSEYLCNYLCKGIYDYFQELYTGYVVATVSQEGQTVKLPLFSCFCE